MSFVGKVGGFIGDVFGKPDKLDHNFNYEFNNSNYNANPNLLASANNLNNMGNKFRGQYDQMIDPNSQYNQSQYAQMGQRLRDDTTAMTNNMNAQLAQRGVGGGGMSKLLGSANLNRVGEQWRLNNQAIANNSMNQAGQFGNMAMGAYGQAGNMYGQVDARNMQNNQFNTQNLNDYNQAQNMSQFNMKNMNLQNAQNYQNNMLSLVGGLAGSAIQGFNPFNKPAPVPVQP